MKLTICDHTMQSIVLFYFIFSTLQTLISYLNNFSELTIQLQHIFSQHLACSLKYLMENTNPEKTSGPLFEILLELHVPKMVFIPDIEAGSSGGFWDLIDSLLLDIYTQASLIPRLKATAPTTYQVRMTVLVYLTPLLRCGKTLS